jgi:HD superfamily phosphodiesterase
MYSGRRNRIPYQRRIEQIQSSVVYLEAITMIADMVIEARKKQDSEKLQQMAKALQDIVFYVNYLESDRDDLVFTITK